MTFQYATVLIPQTHPCVQCHKESVLHQIIVHVIVGMLVHNVNTWSVMEKIAQIQQAFVMERESVFLQTHVRVTLTGLAYNVTIPVALVSILQVYKFVIMETVLVCQITRVFASLVTVVQLVFQFVTILLQQIHPCVVTEMERVFFQTLALATVVTLVHNVKFQFALELRQLVHQFVPLTMVPV